LDLGRGLHRLAAKFQTRIDSSWRLPEQCICGPLDFSFPAALGADEVLVKSTSFAYREEPFGSFLERIVQAGHTREPDGRYLTRAMPPLALDYTRSPLEHPGNERYALADLDPDSLANLPDGVGQMTLKPVPVQCSLVVSCTAVDQIVQRSEWARDSRERKAERSAYRGKRPKRKVGFEFHFPSPF
jgi:hypothetical protein